MYEFCENVHARVHTTSKRRALSAKNLNFRVSGVVVAGMLIFTNRCNNKKVCLNSFQSIGQ